MIIEQIVMPISTSADDKRSISGISQMLVQFTMNAQVSLTQICRTFQFSPNRSCSGLEVPIFCMLVQYSAYI